jgi:hypothetical protein
MQTVAQAEQRFETLLKKSTELRATAVGQYEGFKPEALAGTLWAAYNAVTEVSDWREGKNAAESSLWGARAAEKGRAYAEAVKILG